MLQLKNVSWRSLRGDIVGGLTVAIVALPFAMAFGIASGAGATAGLYAAMFSGFFTSLFGSSDVQVSGPTGAMTVVLVSVIGEYGLEGMFIAGALAGLIQIAVGLLRLGNFVKFLPQAVVSGFMNGIAVLIFLSQVQDGWRDPIITVATVAVMMWAIRYARRSIPAPLWGLAAGVLANELFVRTSHVVGQLPTSLPKLTFPFDHLGNVGGLIVPAFTIFLLGSLETLLAAEVADVITGKKHDSNRELIGQGIGNLVSAVVGGVPVSGAMSRTVVNARSGGRTRLSGMIHSVILIIVVYGLGRWAARIPLAALAGILMVTAVRMADLDGLVLMRRARWQYSVTLLATLLLTIIQDLAVAVGGGLVLAVIFAIAELAAPRVRMKAVARVGRVTLEQFVHPQIQIVKVSGPLLFVSVERISQELAKVKPTQFLVLDFSAVTTIDESAALMLKRLAVSLRDEGRVLYIAGLEREPLRMLTRLQVLSVVGRRRMSYSVATALERAYAEAVALFGLPAAGDVSPAREAEATAHGKAEQNV